MSGQIAAKLSPVNQYINTRPLYPPRMPHLKQRQVLKIPAVGYNNNIPGLPAAVSDRLFAEGCVTVEIENNLYFVSVDRAVGVERHR